MPIYEYSCPSCSTVFEEIVSSHDADTAPCTHCGKTAKRVVSQSAFHLKGEGWYVTEYGNKAPKKETTSSSNSGTKSE